MRVGPWKGPPSTARAHRPRSTPLQRTGVRRDLCPGQPLGGTQVSGSQASGKHSTFRCV